MKELSLEKMSEVSGGDAITCVGGAIITGMGLFALFGGISAPAGVIGIVGGVAIMATAC